MGVANQIAVDSRTVDRVAIVKMNFFIKVHSMYISIEFPFHKQSANSLWVLPNETSFCLPLYVNNDSCSLESHRLTSGKSKGQMKILLAIFGLGGKKIVIFISQFHK